MNESDQLVRDVIRELAARGLPGKPSLSGADVIVQGRRLDIENLRRMMLTGKPRDEVIRHYISAIFDEHTRHTLDTLDSTPFADLRARIMPRIQPESLFEHLDRDQVTHTGFVNGTVILFALDFQHSTVTIKNEQLTRWGVGIDELDDIARHNLRAYSPDPEITFVDSREGGVAAIIAESDGYDASRLLLPGLHRQLAPRLGGTFFAAIPARDLLIAFSMGPEEFVERLHGRARDDHARLPYPTSPDLFVVTADGIAGTR